MTKIGVTIKLKKEVLDTKGRTLLKLLRKETPLVTECHYGKYIELCLDEKDKQKAKLQAEQLTKDFLYNDLIETFELEVLD